ncbi:hypothetical protein LAN31_23455, partial [Mycobacterium tuberculosis]|nr:hypothetical protein [Mycobacterium tuberculosis]
GYGGVVGKFAKYTVGILEVFYTSQKPRLNSLMYWNLATGVFGLPTFNKYTCARSPHLSVCGAYGYPLFHHVEHLYKSGAVSAISDN